MRNGLSIVIGACLGLVLLTSADAPKVKKMSTENKFAGFHEEFFVLKDNPVVKQGPYKKMDMEKRVMVEGYFTKGRMDSIWTYYPKPGTTLKATGRYFDDKKTGIWDYFNAAGKLEQKYDHSNNVLLYYDTESEECEVLMGSGEFKLMTLDVPPLFIGGEAEMASYMKDVFYPEQAKTNEIEGKVVVTMVVGVDGKASDYQVVKGVGYGLDEEALRIAKKLPHHWMPGEFYEEKIPVRIHLPVEFRLTD